MVTHADGVELDRLAMSAYLSGQEEESFALWERAHVACSAEGHVQMAVRCAFWLSFGLMNKGELARAGGWVERGQRLLDDGDHDCVEHGYLAHQVGLRCAISGDAAGGHVAFGRASKLAARFGDAELATLARVGEGRCLIFLGELAEGIARLDEAMAAIASGELSPAAIGDTCCAIIEACHEVFDLPRARAWTATLTRWCDANPDIVLYRRQCLVHRSELMLLGGEWDDAAHELTTACEEPDGPGGVVLGLAWYLRGHLHRLRGELDAAEVAYQRANDLGRPPQPGMVRLLLARGRAEAAHKMARSALHEADDPSSRGALLGPAIEAALAADDAEAAQTLATELAAIAGMLDSELLRAIAIAATGEVLARSDDPAGSLSHLRQAWAAWRDLGAPHEAALLRIAIARVCEALGDDVSAKMERDAARRTFEQLGASGDLQRLDGIEARRTKPLPGGLSQRELEVLTLVAQGQSNRAIAAELVVSEKTVASHVSHIFTKLGVANRASATAFAYEHGLT